MKSSILIGQIHVDSFSSTAALTLLAFFKNPNKDTEPSELTCAHPQRVQQVKRSDTRLCGRVGDGDSLLP